MNSDDVKLKRVSELDGTVTVQASRTLMTDKAAQALLLLAAAPEVRNVTLRVTIDGYGSITAYVHIHRNSSWLGGSGDITRQITLGFASDVTRVEGVTAKLLQRATMGKQLPGDALVVKTLPLLADLDADLDQCLQAALADHREVVQLMAAKRAVDSVHRMAMAVDGMGRQTNRLAFHLTAKLDPTTTLAHGGASAAVLADLVKNVKLLHDMLDQLDQQCATAATAIAALPPASA